MSKTLTFYTNPMSRGRIIRWMLEETGADYDTEYLTFGKTIKGDDYKAINPMGKVPAIRHGETVITECAAICAYLADAFPEAGLAPPTTERGSYYRWLFFTAGPVETAVTNRALGFVVPEDKRIMAGCGTFGEVMDTLEKAVTATPYIAGDAFTAADVYVGSHISWGLGFGTIEKRPAFIEYWSRLKDRPAHLRATELDDAVIAAQKQAG
jgi:glutathione S-transferase